MDILPGLYRHFKGGLYRVEGVARREFDTCDGEKVLEVEAEPYFFVNLWRVYIAYLWVLCYNILDSALEVPHETQGV